MERIPTVPGMPIMPEGEDRVEQEEEITEGSRASAIPKMVPESAPLKPKAPEAAAQAELDKNLETVGLKHGETVSIRHSNGTVEAGWKVFALDKERGAVRVVKEEKGLVSARNVDLKELLEINPRQVQPDSVQESIKRTGQQIGRLVEATKAGLKGAKEGWREKRAERKALREKSSIARELSPDDVTKSLKTTGLLADARFDVGSKEFERAKGVLARAKEAAKSISDENERERHLAQIEGLETEIKNEGKSKKEKEPEAIPGLAGWEAMSEEGRRERVAKAFEEGFGIKNEELEQVEGFRDLSPGQQALVLENLKQITLGRIQDEGLTKFREESKGKILGRSWKLWKKEEVEFQSQFVGKVWRNLFKGYYAGRAEKATAEEIVKGGLKTHGDILKELTAGMVKSGPEVRIGAKGELEIQYLKGEGLPAEEAAKIAAFNKAAAEMAQIPYAWSSARATKSERAKSEKALLAYEKEKQEALGALERKYGRAYTLTRMADADKNVRMNQFLTASPEAEEELEKIQSDKAWQRALGSVVTERGLYMGAGYVTRAITTSFLGAIGVPLAAAGIGGWIARKRAVESLKEEEVIGRAGGKSNLKRRIEKIGGGKQDIELLNFVEAGNLSKKIDSVIGRLNEVKTKEEAEKVLIALDTRLHYTHLKLDRGLVNFGSEKERLAKQYELLQKMSEAEIRLNGFNKEINGGVLDRLDSFLGYKESKVKKYVRDQMIRGALMGAAFATLGYAIRHFFWGNQGVSHADLGTPKAEHAGPTTGIIKPHEVLTVPPAADTTHVFPDTARVGVSATPDTSVTPDSIHTSIEHPTAHPPIAAEHAVPPPAETGAATTFETAAQAGPDTYVEIVGKGDTVWHLTQEQLQKHFGQSFTKLGEAQRTYIIDAIKDRIADDPERFGLADATDIDHVAKGVRIDFSSIFQDRAGMEHIFGRAGGLSEVQVEHILRNNEVLRDWVHAHPHEQLNMERVESILSGKGDEVLTPAPVESAAQVPQIEIKPEVVDIHHGELPLREVPVPKGEDIAVPHPRTNAAELHKTISEAIAGGRRGEFIIPNAENLESVRIRFFYDGNRPVSFRTEGRIIGFDPTVRLRENWTDVLAEKFNLRGQPIQNMDPQRAYLLGRVRDLEMTERILKRLPRNSAETGFLSRGINQARENIVKTFGDLLKSRKL